MDAIGSRCGPLESAGSRSEWRKFGAEEHAELVRLLGPTHRNTLTAAWMHAATATVRMADAAASLADACARFEQHESLAAVLPACLVELGDGPADATADASTAAPLDAFADDVAPLDAGPAALGPNPRDPDTIPDLVPRALAPAELPLFYVAPSDATPYATSDAHLSTLLDVVAARAGLAIAAPSSLASLVDPPRPTPSSPGRRPGRDGSTGVLAERARLGAAPRWSSANSVRWCRARARRLRW